MSPRRRNLTPWELLDAPELASLATLGSVLRITSFAIIAAHPMLAEPVFNRDLDDPEARIANRIIDATDGLQRLIRSYRRALRQRARHLPSEEEILF